MLQKERMGYGHDIVVGLKAAKHDVLAWTHADMQTDINDVILGFNLYRSFLDSNNNTNIIVKIFCSIKSMLKRIMRIKLYQSQ